MLVLATSITSFRILATTVDTSIGRAFDRVSALLQLKWTKRGPGHALEQFCLTGEEPSGKNEQAPDSMSTCRSGSGSSSDSGSKHSSPHPQNDGPVDTDTSSSTGMSSSAHAYPSSSADVPTRSTSNPDLPDVPPFAVPMPNRLVFSYSGPHSSQAVG